MTMTTRHSALKPGAAGRTVTAGGACDRLCDSNLRQEIAPRQKLVRGFSFVSWARVELNYRPHAYQANSGRWPVMTGTSQKDLQLAALISVDPQRRLLAPPLAPRTHAILP